MKFASKKERVIFWTVEFILDLMSLALLAIILYGYYQFFTCGPCDWDSIKEIVWSKG